MNKTVAWCLGISLLVNSSSGMASIAMTGHTFEVNTYGGTQHSGEGEGSVEGFDFDGGTLSIALDGSVSDQKLRSSASGTAELNRFQPTDPAESVHLTGFAKSIFEQIGVVQNAGENTHGFLQVDVQVDGILSVSVDTTSNGFTNINNVSAGVTLVSETPGATLMLLDEVIGFSDTNGENEVQSDELIVDTGVIEIPPPPSLMPFPLIEWSGAEEILISLALMTSFDIDLYDIEIATVMADSSFGETVSLAVEVLDEEQKRIEGAEFVFIPDVALPEPGYLLPFVFGVVIPVSILNMRRRDR